MSGEQVLVVVCSQPGPRHHPPRRGRVFTWPSPPPCLVCYSNEHKFIKYNYFKHFEIIYFTVTGALAGRRWTSDGRWTGPATSSARGASSWSRYRQIMTATDNDSWWWQLTDDDSWHADDRWMWVGAATAGTPPARLCTGAWAASRPRTCSGSSGQLYTGSLWFIFIQIFLLYFT